VGERLDWELVLVEVVFMKENRRWRFFDFGKVASCSLKA
jgi:hypothetical protein